MPGTAGCVGIFWEERNTWFSDIWTDIKGTAQDLPDGETRARSGAFPLELPYRLIQMYSVYGDTVLDPFVGTGTTMLAAMISARNSIGMDIDRTMAAGIAVTLKLAPCVGENRVRARLVDHEAFVRRRQAEGRDLKHMNKSYGFPVVTSQEIDLEFYHPASIQKLSRYAFRLQHRRGLPAARTTESQRNF